MKTTMRTVLKTCVWATVFLSALAFGSIGSFFHDVAHDLVQKKNDALTGAANTFGDAANLALKTVIAPPLIYKNVASIPFGGKPEDVLKPLAAVAVAGGTTLKAANGTVIEPERFLYDKAGQFANDVGGKPGSFIFDVATFSQRFYGELGYSSIEVAANTLKGQNPLAVVATPLAAAIHEAHEKYKSTAKPLPEDVKQGLSRFFVAGILNQAKYAVGSVDITLPDFIGQAKKFQGVTEQLKTGQR